eukprot:9307901-Pyramimonas_sp.AAC.1
MMQEGCLFRQGPDSDMFVSLLSAVSLTCQDWKDAKSEGRYYDAMFSFLGLNWSETTVRMASVELEEVLFTISGMKWREGKNIEPAQPQPDQPGDHGGQPPEPPPGDLDEH